MNLRLVFGLLGAVLLAGCDRGSAPPGPSGAAPGRGAGPAASVPQPRATLADARSEFQTRLLRQERSGDPVPSPPAGLRLVKYPSPSGEMAAYLSAAPRDGRKRPAIVWIFGGFDNGIGETAWEPASPDNDQSARAFRQAGVITLYPSVRGGNRNPGFKEGFLGEVEDVIAAAQWLATQPGVDPKRIYLGGHSTGGTLALLTAASTSSLFRAVISFGPIDDIRGYGQENLPFDVGSREEVLLRSPIVWLDGIQTPTAVIEGEQQGNIEAVVNMARQTKNPKLRFVRASGHDHFSVLAHATPLVARAILADTGPTANLALTGVGTDIGP